MSARARARQPRRDRAQLRAPGGRARRGCARSSRPTPTGTARAPRARRARRRRSWLAVAAAAEAVELRGAGIDAPILVMGALTREELARRSTRDADVVAWSEEFIDWAAGARARRACTSSSTAGWGASGRATAALADRLASGRRRDARARAGRGDDALRDRRGAGPRVPAQPARALRELGRRRGASACRGCSCTPRTAPPCSAARPAASTWRAAAARSTALDPFGVDPARFGLEAALELRSWVAARKPCAPGESAGYGRRSSRASRHGARRDPGRLRRRRAPHALQQRRGPDRRSPPSRSSGPSAWTTSPSSWGPAAAVAVGAPVVAARAPTAASGSRPRRSPRAQGTINYEVTCAISARVPRRYHRDGEWRRRPARCRARARGARRRRCWVVGGAVRDELPASTPSADLDLVVDGEVAAAARALARARARRGLLALGRVRRLARRRARRTPGRSTSARCAGATIEADLALRDFTVNAIARPLAGGAPIDP